MQWMFSVCLTSEFGCRPPSASDPDASIWNLEFSEKRLSSYEQKMNHRPVFPSFAHVFNRRCSEGRGGGEGSWSCPRGEEQSFLAQKRSHNRPVLICTPDRVTPDCGTAGQWHHREAPGPSRDGAGGGAQHRPDRRDVQRQPGRPGQPPLPDAEQAARRQGSSFAHLRTSVIPGRI